MKKFFLYVPLVVVLAVFGFFGKSHGEFFGLNIAFGYGGGGGGGGSSGSFVTSITAIDVPLTINGTQAGTLTYNAGGDDSVYIVIPVNSFTGSATFKVVGSSLGDFSPTNGSVIGGGVYVISATDANNNSVTNFNNNLTITFSGLSLPADVSNVGVYFLNETTNEWVLIPGSIIDPAAGTVVFIVNHFTKFAVLNVPGTPTTVKTTKTVAAVTPTTPVVSGPISTYQVDSLTVKFRAGLTEKQMTGITNLVNSGRLFSETDAKNYAWAINQTNWQQYVGKNPGTIVSNQTSGYQVDGLTVKFRTGLTTKQMAGITDLVDSGRNFSETDARNYAWAINQTNWQQFVGTNPKLFRFTAQVRFGSVGNEVRALQQKLKDLGYFNYPSITGYFGTVTKNALINYQKAKGLTATGIMDANTRAALNAE